MRIVARPLLALFLAAGALGAAPAPDKIRILATVFPLREFAATVAGERGETSLLLPPGAGVHTWQPRPEDIVRLASCDLLLYIGSGLEPWLPGMLRAFPQGHVRTLEAAAGLAVAGPDQDEEPGRVHDHSGLDPHVWLDFGLDLRIVDRIAAELARLDPAGGAEFDANAGRLKDRLKKLDAEFETGLSGCRGKSIVLAGHAAFGYLARRYGLVQTALYGLSPDAQPKPKDLMKAVEFCRRQGIRTVFFENSVPPDLSKTLAREIGGRVLALQAGHNLTRDQQAHGVGFFELMEGNLAALKDGLGCR
ncbi:MAG: metal ABC transporter solute-binding protein, Zn/Mn family [Candidatus Aminicenantes bacterium RBG_16_66_30]